MKIQDFTQQDLELFRRECNFTDLERQCFELKARNWTDIQISMELNISESTVAVYMRKVRKKIDEVLRQNIKQTATSDIPGTFVICHTMTEWSKIPNFLSGKGVIYVYSDYRTENGINIPRIKIGDGINPLSELPFATMSITDDDMSYWDGKPDDESNNFGKTIDIDKIYSGENKFTFPTDGYLMLEFNASNDYARVHIYGKNDNSYFEFEKRPGIDIHSKEVFVKKGMKCLLIDASNDAKIRFVPLI